MAQLPDTGIEGGSQLQLAAIVEESHDAIIGKTLDGIITSWNGGAQKMFGYLPEEVIGKPMTNLFPDDLKDELPRLLEKVKRGEVIADYDSVWLRKDGTRADVEFSISPVHIAGSKIIGASLVGRDITQRKKSEESLRQTKLIVENSHDAIIGESLEGIITSWNGGAERLFGYAPSEVIGKSALILLPKDRQDEVPVLFSKIRAGDVVADYDSVRIRKDGTMVDIALSISPVKNEAGVVVGASVVERDISVRKESERHIRELNETRNKFITIISHQLRTPLTAVNWNVEMLLNGDFGELKEVQYKFLQVTHTASVEITHRIHTLLTAMDIEEGRVKYEMEKVAIDSVYAAVLNETKPRCKLKNITCNYAVADQGVPPVEADAEKIRMMIGNMMDNAISYTKEGGTIAAKLTYINKTIRFEVTDTGVGIPESEQHRVFSRFFRGSNASVMEPNAFGLGLFVAKSFATQHGGTMGFESSEGVGTTFWCEIPLHQQI